MKRAILITSLIMLGAFLKASNVITTLTVKNFGKTYMTHYIIEYDSVVSVKETYIIPEAPVYLYNGMPISESWKNKEGYYLISFYTPDTIYSLTLPELGIKVFSNKENELAFSLTDTEVYCDNDLMDVVIIELDSHQKTGRLSVRDNKVKVHLKNNNIAVAYFDENPRGAGISPKDILLKVIDCDKKKVFIADHLDNLTDFPYEKNETIFANFDIQWLDNYTFAYMKRKYLDKNTSILSLYTYNIKTKKRELIKDIKFPYSIENIKFQLVGDCLYIMNRYGLFLICENSIKQLLNEKNLIDFYINYVDSTFKCIN